MYVCVYRYVCTSILYVALMYNVLIFCVYIVDAPRVTIDPAESPYRVNVGKRLLLYCIAEGFPIPTIRWYKNNVLIPRQSSPFYLVSTNVPLTTVYTCEGRNNAGNMRNIARANITIIIIESMFFLSTI